MPFIKLNAPDVFQEALARSKREPVVLYKHSATCPISAAAHREVEKLTEAEAPPVFKLVIQQARALSAEIAQALDVRHESPQVIVVADGKPVFHTSHHQVTAQAVREAASEARV